MKTNHAFIAKDVMDYFNKEISEFSLTFHLKFYEKSYDTFL